MDYRYRILQRETCYEGFFRLVRLRLRHAQFAGGMGASLTRECIHKGEAAGVLLYEAETDCVALVEQFRVGALEQAGADASQAWLLELVAGYREAGEGIEDVARRETLEEAGCTVLDLIPICRYLVSPGGSSETMSLFCARVRAPRSGSIHGVADEGEDIRLHVLPVEDAWQRLQDGGIGSAAPVIALQWLRLHHRELRARWAGS
ncbi:MAG: NUDIX domain-containing protein [Gammaproteobacteria bacterium]